MFYELFTDWPFSLTRKNGLEKICVSKYKFTTFFLITIVYVYQQFNSSSNNGHFSQCFHMNLEENVSFFRINFEMQNFQIKGYAHLKC